MSLKRTHVAFNGQDGSVAPAANTGAGVPMLEFSGSLDNDIDLTILVPEDYEIGSELTMEYIYTTVNAGGDSVDLSLNIALFDVGGADFADPSANITVTPSLALDTIMHKEAVQLTQDGQISGQAIAPGDILRVNYKRLGSTDTDNGLLRLWNGFDGFKMEYVATDRHA
jgi:hypothetical protein